MTPTPDYPYQVHVFRKRRLLFKSPLFHRGDDATWFARRLEESIGLDATHIVITKMEKTIETIIV